MNDYCYHCYSRHAVPQDASRRSLLCRYRKYVWVPAGSGERTLTTAAACWVLALVASLLVVLMVASQIWCGNLWFVPFSAAMYTMVAAAFVGLPAVLIWGALSLLFDR